MHSKPTPVLNQLGMSLLEVMIAIGIMSIITLGMMSAISQQSKETKFISEKIISIEVDSQLRAVFKNPDFCSCIFRGKTFNTATKSWSSGVTEIPRSFTTIPAFPGGCTASADKVVKNGLGFSGTDLTTNLITFDILATSEISPGSGHYLTSLQVEFAGGIRKMQNVKVGLNFKINPTGGTGPTVRPFVSCEASAASSPATALQGFCTPRNDWENANTYVCPVFSGYDELKLTGVFNFSWRGVSCCYLPQTTGSNGWCSPDIPSWNGSFSSGGSATCSGNANYTAVQIQGIQGGAYDQTACCYIPNSQPLHPSPFSMINRLVANDSLGGSTVPLCGGPFAEFDTIPMNFTDGATGRNILCTYVPK